MTAPPTVPHWRVLVPIKALKSAKQRLSGHHVSSSELALAFGLDVITATRQCAAVARVIVVTEDPVVSREAEALGALVVTEQDESLKSGRAGLNDAIRQAECFAGSTGVSSAIAVVTADLPTLRPGLLASLLDHASGLDRSFVADHLGSGTSILCTSSGLPIEPRFGAGSAEAHRRSGARDLSSVADPCLRLDVDTQEDLAAALELGVGPHTAALLA